MFRNYLSLTRPSDVGTITISVLQMRKPRREKLGALLLHSPPYTKAKANHMGKKIITLLFMISFFWTVRGLRGPILLGLYLLTINCCFYELSG